MLDVQTATKPVKPNAFTSTGPAIYIKPTVVSKAAATRVNKNICATAWCGATKGERAAR